MLLLGGNSVGVAHARKTHRGKYGEATPWRQRGGGGSPPPYPLKERCREESVPKRFSNQMFFIPLIYFG